MSWDGLLHYASNFLHDPTMELVMNGLKIFCMTYIVMQILVYLLSRWVKKVVVRLKDDFKVPGIVYGIPFLVSLAIVSQTHLLEVSPAIRLLSMRVLGSVLTINVLYIIIYVFLPLLQFLRGKNPFFSEITIRWLSLCLKCLIFFLCGTLVLRIWGVDVIPLIAGLGLLGVAVALSTQDLLKNLLGGFVVIAEKRFAVGDTIKIDNTLEGVVQGIRIRSTMIQRVDGTISYVPNAKMSDAIITNVTHAKCRRVVCNVSLTTISDFARLRQFLQSILDTHEKVVKDFGCSPCISVEGEALHSLVFQISFYVYCDSHDDYNALRAEFLLKMRKLLDADII